MEIPMRKNLAFIALSIIFLSTAHADAQKAGKGSYEPRTQKLDGAAVDKTPILPRQHYLRIEVPKWYVNNQSNFMKDKIVSGTVEIKIGEENYNAILGTFPLSGDNRTSPVFDRALVDNRVYNGGDLTIKVFIKGIKKDTVMGGLLKNLADTALNVAVGQVATMTGMGAIPALNDASKTLTAGVKETLNKGESQHGIFEESGGLEKTFRKSDLAEWGNETFWIAYRGDSLSGKTVKVISDGQGSYDVQVDNSPLRQGAWVLFRISRESAYGNYRPWMARAEQARNDLNSLMENWKFTAKTLAEVKTELGATLKGDHVADRILALRSVIESDSVLSVPEQGLEKTKLMTLLGLAIAATGKPEGYDNYFAEAKKFEDSLKKGTIPDSEIAKAVATQEFKLLERQAAEESEDTSIYTVITKGGADFLYSTSGTRTTDTSLMAAEQQLEQAALKQTLTQTAKSVKDATTLTETELWKQLGEVERAQKAKQKK